MNNKINKIVIFRTEHIGDLLLSLGAIKSLREAYPDSQITLVVGPWNEDLAKKIPYINKFIIFNNPFVKRNLKIKDIFHIFLYDFKKIINKVNEINKEKADLLVIFSNRRYNKLFLKMIKSKIKLSDFSFDIFKNDQQRQLNILKKFGIKKIYKRANLKEDSNDQEEVFLFLKKKRILKNNIVIQPFSPDEKKNWNVKNWIELIDQILKKDSKKHILLIGSKEERNKIEEITKNVYNKKNVFNIAGKFNLIQTYLLIKESSLFIGIDSGIKHLTELTNVPSIILFGPTYNKMWAPTRKIDYIIKEESMEKIVPKKVLNYLKRLHQI